MKKIYFNSAVPVAIFVALLFAFGSFESEEERIYEPGPTSSEQASSAMSSPLTPVEGSPLHAEVVPVGGPPVVPTEESQQKANSSKSYSWNTDVVEVPAIASKSVYESMLAYQASGGFTFSGREYVGLGFMLESINGKGPSGGKYWFLYINGISSPTGASQTTLKAGDRIEWRYKQSE